MTRAAQQKVYADFSKGYITEGNRLSYPEDAASELINFDIRDNGSLHRRLGLAYASSFYIDMPSSTDPLAVNSFVWEDVAGISSHNLTVVQTGDILSFYNNATEDILSQGKAYPDIVLAPAKSFSAADVKRTNVRTAFGSGALFVVGKYIEPFYIELKEGSLVSTDIRIKIRDFKILKEENPDTSGDRRQASMTGHHQYNLYNQGWPDKRDLPPFSETGERAIWISLENNRDGDASSELPLLETFFRTGLFPSLADNLSAFRSGRGNTGTKQKAYDIEIWEQSHEGNTKAARGHSILDAFSRVRKGVGYTADITPGYEVCEVVDYEIVETCHWVPATVEQSSTPTIDTTYTPFRPTSVAFYAGRVWYAGVEGASFSSEIYYSQIIETSLSKAGLCMQAADPTAEVVNELIATDGGLLSIEEMGTVRYMYPFGTSLLLFSSQGVWSIGGSGENNSFSATDMAVSRLSNKSVTSLGSTVVGKDSAYFLEDSALYRVGRDELGSLQVTEASAPISSFFRELTKSQKLFSIGVFDKGNNKAYWYYPSRQTPVLGEVPVIDRCLILDDTTGAFAKYELSVDAGSLIRAGTSSTTATTLVETVQVVSNNDPVVSGGQPVVQTTAVVIPERSSIKLLVVEGDQYTFAEHRGKDFKDLGTSYVSTLETGFDSLGDVMRKTKISPKIVFHLERTETGFITDPTDVDGEELIYKGQSGCLVSYAWDWGNLDLAKQFQAYTLSKNYIPSGISDSFQYDRSVATTTTRLRGRGTSLGFRIESEEGKDMKLLGYGILYTASSRI